MAALYRVLQRSAFPDVGLLEPGAEVEWDGVPGSALEPLNAEARKAMAALAKKPAGKSAPADHATTKHVADLEKQVEALETATVLLTQERDTLAAENDALRAEVASKQKEKPPAS